jgi:hypothetical protein
MATHWEDVFLTRDTDHSLASDDTFVAPMMSVRVVKNETGADFELTTTDATTNTSINVPQNSPNLTLFQTQGNLHALIEPEQSSNWLMHAFPGDLTSEFADGRMKNLKVGDQIRVGLPESGFTDYLTIMEIVQVQSLHNTSKTETVHLSPGDKNSGSDDYPDTTTNNSFTGSAQTPTLNLSKVSGTTPTQNNWIRTTAFNPDVTGFDLAFRINYAIDATNPPAGTVPHHQEFFARGKVTTSGTVLNTAISSATRANARIYSPGTKNMHYFPMFKLNAWSETMRNTMSLRLPTSLGKVYGIKLVGYAFSHGADRGFQAHHEGRSEDWYALKIDHINGSVLSNNYTAEGAFHILHAGNAHNRRNGSTQVYDYDSHGLATQTFPPRNLPVLSVHVTGLNGAPANFGRMHLWMRVLVGDS